MQWWRPHTSAVCLHASLQGCRDKRQTQLHGGKSTRAQEAQGRAGEMTLLLKHCLHLSLLNRPAGSAQHLSEDHTRGLFVQGHTRSESTEVSLHCPRHWWKVATVQRSPPRGTLHPLHPSHAPDALLPREKRPLSPATQLGLDYSPLLLVSVLFVVKTNAGLCCNYSFSPG